MSISSHRVFQLRLPAQVCAREPVSRQRVFNLNASFLLRFALCVGAEVTHAPRAFLRTHAQRKRTLRVRVGRVVRAHAWVSRQLCVEPEPPTTWGLRGWRTVGTGPAAFLHQPPRMQRTVLVLGRRNQIHRKSRSDLIFHIYQNPGIICWYNMNTQTTKDVARSRGERRKVGCRGRVQVVGET